MPDREKVIKGIQECDLNGGLIGNCPYKEVVELLKEQDAKRPNMMQDVEGIWSTCPTCGHKLRAILAMKMNTYFPKYCSECGQAVKWE